MICPAQCKQFKGSFLEKVILELNSKGCVGVAELKSDQQEQKLRDSSYQDLTSDFLERSEPFWEKRGVHIFPKNH